MRGCYRLWCFCVFGPQSLEFVPGRLRLPYLALPLLAFCAGRSLGWLLDPFGGRCDLRCRLRAGAVEA